MKLRHAMMALAGTTAVFFTQTTHAQNPFKGLFRPPANQTAPDNRNGGTANAQPRGAAPVDPNVRTASNRATILEPTPLDQIEAPAIQLPQDAIEPYLLTKDAGPFMVLARTFRGPEAERFALALVLELRNEYQLPAYILRTKDFPRNSNIRNVPPTAPPGVDRARLGDPERVRTYDEAAVLVGNEKSLKGSEVLLHKVKKIRPRCLDGLPKLYFWREGLSSATRTTNPYVPAQNIYPGNKDAFVERMNQAPNSIYHCPGRYSLQIADFSGRGSFEVNGMQAFDDGGLKRSPLVTAANDAEELAEGLAKAAEIRQLGQPVYVYHDRTSSKVLIGSFQAPNDPAAVRLREEMIRLSAQLIQPNMKVGRKKAAVDKMIVPASVLTDLETIKPH